MKNKQYPIFFIITDLHLGLLNKTDKLVENLISYFTKYSKKLSKVDVIVLDGDTFDRLLATNSIEYKLAVKFIAYLVSFCKHYNIKLRVLEGTPSHDNKQFEAITEMISREYGMGSIDYRYVSAISIEYMKDYDKHILYMPDKMAESGDEIQEKISQVLKDNGLVKVDLIFAHGNFKYQLPIKTKSCLSESFFLDICNYYIIIGHIHIRSIFKRIIAPGSFDRMEVNNEGPKGGVLLYIKETIDLSSYEFLDNDNAMRYDTLNYENMNSKEIYKKVKYHIEKNNLNMYDHIRLKVDSSIIFKEVKKALVSDGYTLTIKMFDNDNSDKKVVYKPIENTIETFEITPENIFSLLIKRDRFKTISDDDKERIKKILKGGE